MTDTLTLTVPGLARVLGRSPSWVQEHWRREVAAKRLPAPINGGAAPLTWSAPQVYAYLDRPLPASARAYAAAWRAAHAAAASPPPEIEDVLEARERLDRQFAPATTGNGQ